MEQNRAVKALAITIIAVLVTRSLLSARSLLHLMAWQVHALNERQVDHMKLEIKKLGIMAAAMLFVMIAAVPAFASSGMAEKASPYEQQALQARYDMASAHIGYITGVMSDTVSLIPQASNLQQPADKLNADLATLQGYVSSANKDGFNDYIKSTITPDVKAAQSAIQDDRKDWKSWNVTNATRQQLKADYQNRKTTYETQVSNAWVELGKVRLDAYNDAMSRSDTVIANMSSKGFDVSGMQAVESGAKSNVIAPLQSAVDSNDGNTVKAELKAKCLDDGAPYSYHFAANMDLQRLKSVTAKLSASANSSGVQEKLSDVNAKLDSTAGTLQAVGTSPYSGSQRDQVWDPLKAASEELKSIIHEAKGGQNKQG